MKAKIRLLSIMMSLIVIASPLLPWAETMVLAQDVQMLTIEDRKLYDELKSCFAGENIGVLQASDDENQTLTLNMERVTQIQVEKADMTLYNSQSILETLFLGCNKLNALILGQCNLNEFDFSSLNNKDSLSSLYLVSCKLERIPDLTLPNLDTICVSRNNLSAAGACENLTKETLTGFKPLSAL